MFVCIFKVEKRVLMNQIKSNGTVTEKLYIPKNQYGLYLAKKRKPLQLEFEF